MIDEMQTPEKLLGFLRTVGTLRDRLRHSWTKSGRPESVAEHSWRLALLALLVGREIEGIDRDRLIEMCLIHDLGETVTGDIPAFDKTDSDECAERAAVRALVASLPESQAGELTEMFEEIWERRTPESRLLDALDRLEAVISHNEADLSTWVAREYELNLVYGEQSCAPFATVRRMREIEHRKSMEKLAAAGRTEP